MWRFRPADEEQGWSEPGLLDRFEGMTKRTSKKQQARELAMEALAEQIEKQRRVQTATQRAFLAQGEFDEVRERFAESLQELDTLGEPQAWIRETFGLTASELRALLTLNRGEDSDSDNGDDDSVESPSHESGETDSDSGSDHEQQQ